MGRMLAYRPMERLLATVLGALAIVHAQAADKPDRKPFNASLEPGKIHEECLRLEAGEKRRYHWKATGPVDFNIHFHRGPEVFYPVKRDAMRGDGGTFAAKSGEDYCWMWKARDTTVRVEGSIDP